MKHKLIYALISGVAIIPGIISLFLWGLKPSIDFTGGSLWEIRASQEITSETINKALESKNIDFFPVQKVSGGGFLIRTRTISEQEKNSIMTELKKNAGEIQELRFESVGPSLGRELLIRTLTGLIIASISIMFYLGWRFKSKMYGVSAILAMLHDSLVLIGLFSILGHFFGAQVDTLFVTALLTVLSFSVHDTVVVYDRIRESIKNNPHLNMESLANKAITETMTRSLNNSLTIIFMLTALAVLGGGSIRYFSIALLIGTISGTYSSPFVAVPLLVLWDKYGKKK